MQKHVSNDQQEAICLVAKKVCYTKELNPTTHLSKRFPGEHMI